jgi:hypothetical protein
MSKLLTDSILENIDQAKDLYYQLVLVVGPADSGKTIALQDVHARISAPLINVNLELSQRLLDLTERQRALQLSRILTEIVTASAGDVVLLDNIELLFDISLKQDPLRLLQGLSRHKTIVAAWNGTIENGHLIYATPDHPEYRRYPVQDFLAVMTEPNT